MKTTPDIQFCVDNIVHFKRLANAAIADAVNYTNTGNTIAANAAYDVADAACDEYMRQVELFLNSCKHLSIM
jgi:hypothetical protein